MPSSFSRRDFRFLCRGLDLAHPINKCLPGGFPILNNMRVAVDGSVQARNGISKVSDLPATDGPVVNSIGRMNNPVPVGVPAFSHYIGCGTKLYADKATGAYTTIDSGYSGMPLSMLPFRPNACPEPWMYVGDSLQMRKYRTNGASALVGVVPPNAPPTVTLGKPNYTSLADFSAVGAWVNGGQAGAITSTTRINTTIASILYDVGTSGWACINPTVIDSNTQPGCLVKLGGSEVAKVTDVFEAATNTTITAALYDTGFTGLCSLTLAGTGTGLQPNAMIRLDSGLGSDEYVRVLSVTIGQDGIPSIRVSTVNFHGPTGTVTGLASFRAYTVATFVATNTITASAFNSTITAIAGDLQDTGTLALTAALNLSTINGRPLTADDYMHISINLDNPSNLVQGEIDIDFGDGSFTKNYYYYTITQNVFQQSVSGQSSLVSAGQSAISRQILIDALNLQNSNNAGLADKSIGTTDYGQGIDTTNQPDPNAVTGPVAAQAVSGVSQWTELKFKIADLLAGRVGSDTTRSLRDVVAIRISLTISATTVVRVSSWWTGGTYGPDLGLQGAPLIYRYIYRSSQTGAKSAPSPQIRSGVNPYRDRIVLNCTASTDPQIDTIDVFRFGGGLDVWSWIGAFPNTTAAINDDFTAVSIAGRIPLAFDQYRPFPVVDLPRTGTCNVSGTSVTWASGDAFNGGWAEGTQIIISGVPYTLYGTPKSGAFLQLQESAGAQTGATFYLPEALIAGVPLPYTWAFGGQGFGTFVMGTGDPNNPGYLHWCKGNDPDASSNTGVLEITSPSEPLLNGFTYDGRAYVFSTERLFAIYPDFSNPKYPKFVAQEMPTAKGLFAPWAFCVGPKVWWLGKSGIWEWAGGAPVNITDTMLYPLFPHSGQAAVSVNGYNPPDFLGFPQFLRLSYADSELKFTFQDTTGVFQCYRYDLAHEGWFPAQYTPSINCVYEDQAEEVNQVLLGSVTSSVYAAANNTTDAGSAINWQVRTPIIDQGDARGLDLYLDLYVDTNPNNGAIAVDVYYDLWTSLVHAGVLSGSNQRNQTVLNLSNASQTLHTDAAYDFTGTGPSTLFAIQTNSQNHPYLGTTFTSQYVDHGFITFGHMREFWFGLISTTDVVFTIQTDPGTPYGATYTFTIPKTGGIYRKVYFPTPPIKCSVAQYTATSTAPWTPFPNEITVHLKEWGSAGAFNSFKPFANLLNSIAS